MRGYFPKSYLPRSYFGLKWRKAGSVLFPCHKFKDPAIIVGLSDCMHCPHGPHWQDFDGDGFEECEFEWQDRLERLKQVEAEREQEKRDFEELLKRNQEDSERLREMWAREVAEHEALKREMEERDRRQAKLKERQEHLGLGVGQEENQEWDDWQNEEEPE